MKKLQNVIPGIMAIAAFAALTTACGFAGAGEPTDDPGTADVFSSVSVSDQTLAFSAVVTIASIDALEGGFVAIHEDDGGSPGAVISHASIPEGTSTDVELTLNRFAQDQETLHAMLHVDDPADGMFTFDGQNGEDPPITGQDGTPISASFTVTVGPDTVDIRVTISNNGFTAYMWSEVEPSDYATDFGQGGSNPEITLRSGLRYEFVNNAYPSHPLEFIDQTRNDQRSGDTVLVGQDDAGTLSRNTAVNLVESGNTFRISVVEPLVSSIEGYRNAVEDRRLNMRGNVVVVQ